jgi:hypothetical protein
LSDCEPNLKPDCGITTYLGRLLTYALFFYTPINPENTSQLSRNGRDILKPWFTRRDVYRPGEIRVNKLKPHSTRLFGQLSVLGGSKYRAFLINSMPIGKPRFHPEKSINEKSKSINPRA